MKKNIVIFLFFIAGFFTNSCAQDLTDFSAEDFFKVGDYNRALDGYKKLFKTSKDKVLVNYRIGQCILKVNLDKSLAIPYLEFVFKNGKYDDELLFDLGLAYMYAYQFDKAINYFLDFKMQVGVKKSQEADRYIENCKNAPILMQHPIDVKFINLGKTINSKFPDYYPFVTKNEGALYFTSRREANQSKIKSWQGYFTADVYSSKVVNGAWTKAKGIGPIINTAEDEECVGISPSGEKMVLYADNLSVSGDLFLSKLEGKKKVFSKPIPFDSQINTEFLELEGCINEDASILIVSSDRPKGLGGMDLYMFKKLPNDQWGAAINLGPQVNTKYDEAFPIFDEDNNILYFASEGHLNMGGFDIFVSNYNVKTGKFEEAVNIGYPINTPEDNMQFTLADNKRDGYVSAVRKEGFGDLDLYKVEFQNVEENVSVIRGHLSTSDNLKKPIEAFVNLLDAKTNDTLFSKDANPKTGKFVFAVPTGNYIINVTSEGYDEVNLPVNVLGKSDRVFDIEKNIVLIKSGTVKPPVNNKVIPKGK